MATRKEYIEKLAAKLHEWDAGIDELRQKAELSGIEMRQVLKRRISEMRDRRDRAALLLNELREVGDDAWSDVKTRVDKLYGEVRDIFRKAA